MENNPFSCNRTDAQARVLAELPPTWRQQNERGCYVIGTSCREAANSFYDPELRAACWTDTNPIPTDSDRFRKTSSNGQTDYILERPNGIAYKNT